jgi:hypothetical protein
MDNVQKVNYCTMSHRHKLLDPIYMNQFSSCNLATKCARCWKEQVPVVGSILGDADSSYVPHCVILMASVPKRAWEVSLSRI